MEGLGRVWPQSDVDEHQLSKVVEHVVVCDSPRTQQQGISKLLPLSLLSTFILLTNFLSF